MTKRGDGNCGPLDAQKFPNTTSSTRTIHMPRNQKDDTIWSDRWQHNASLSWRPACGMTNTGGRRRQRRKASYRIAYTILVDSIILPHTHAPLWPLPIANCQLPHCCHASLLHDPYSPFLAHLLLLQSMLHADGSAEKPMVHVVAYPSADLVFVDVDDPRVHAQ